MKFLIDTKPDILISNYRHDTLIGLYYDREVIEQPRICLVASGDMVEGLLNEAKENKVFVLEDVGLIFLLEDYEVGEYIEREIFQPVAAALAWSYKQMAK